jgi:hypothetical protein
MQSLVAVLLARAADLLERVDLTPAVLRADLAGPRVAPHRIYAAEVLSRGRGPVLRIGRAGARPRMPLARLPESDRGAVAGTDRWHRASGAERH